MRTFIFACIHNAGRSQMAAAFFNKRVDSTKAKAVSAGTQPADHVHPIVLEMMQEVGIDLSHAKPQKLTDELASKAEMLITMGCGEQCPHIPGLQHDDWPLADPKGKDANTVRIVRDEIEIRIYVMLKEKGLLRA